MKLEDLYEENVKTMSFMEFKKSVSRQLSPFRIILPISEMERYRIGRNPTKVRDKRSFKKDGVWHVFPAAVRPSIDASGWVAAVICPYCGEIHMHHHLSDSDQAPHCDSSLTYHIDLNNVDVQKNITSCRFNDVQSECCTFHGQRKKIPSFDDEICKNCEHFEPARVPYTTVVRIKKDKLEKLNDICTSPVCESLKKYHYKEGKIINFDIHPADGSRIRLHIKLGGYLTEPPVVLMEFTYQGRKIISKADSCFDYYYNDVFARGGFGFSVGANNRDKDIKGIIFSHQIQFECI